MSLLDYFKKGEATLDKVWQAFEIVLEDWGHMQKATYEEGDEAAERFETHFYVFINELDAWFSTLNNEDKPADVIEAEKHPLISKIQGRLPDPLSIPFTNELERVIDGEDYQLSD